MADTIEALPYTVLRDHLSGGEAAPLELSIRRLMEDRFRTDFGDVRIHTGPAAAALCRALQARAFTLGSDVFFGEGQYLPGSRAGQRLLAHELVHVLQQRLAQSRTASPVVLIGDPMDDCESEADRLAEEVLGGGLRSAVTPDATGAIRRAIAILDGTADIKTIYSGPAGTTGQDATPGLSYNRHDSLHWALLHLTRGSAELIAHRHPNPVRASAINLTGTVMVQADVPLSDIKANYSFHFIQLFKDVKNIAFYAGQTSAEGCMSFDFAGPAHFRGYRQFMIDSDPNDPNHIPNAEQGQARWTPLNSYGLWQVSVSEDDHPNREYLVRLDNPMAGNKMNYLYKVVREYEVITVLVVRDMNTFKYRPLAHVKWGTSCEANLHWNLNGAGAPDAGPALVAGRFAVSAATQGPPSDPAAQAMILNPSTNASDMYNKAADDANAAMAGTTPDLDIDLRAGWSWTVPTNHFKP
jgi:hypothetical protein